MFETAVGRSFNFDLGETFEKLRQHHRDEYHNALIRIVLSLFFVVSSHQFTAIGDGDNLALAAFASIALGFHLGAQAVFLHLVLSPNDVRLRRNSAVLLDLAVTLFAPFLWAALGLVLVPWLLWSSRFRWFDWQLSQPASDQPRFEQPVRMHDYIVTASHDLKAPLGGIINTVEGLQATEISTEQRELLRLLKASCRVLRNYADQVLDGDRLANASLKVSSINDDLHARLSDIADVGQALAMEKGLSFICHTERGVPEKWYGDGAKLDQVLVNLIANAVKFTDSGCVTVCVSLQKNKPMSCFQKPTLRFTVSDTGAGISEAARNAVFERYQQAEEHASQRYLGHGLGLSICQETIQLMGGELSIDSTPGKGTVFQIDLPYLQPLSETPCVIDKLDISPNTVLLPQTKISRILAIDDDPFTRRVYSFIAKRFAAEIDFAATGAEALRLLKKSRYDVILLDQNLPDTSGLALADQILEKARFTNIILVTGDHTISAAAIWQPVGIRVMLAKPIDSQRLQNEVGNFIGTTL